ncbi:MAG TPA: hypothetical protein EYG93_02980 [Sulfurospirillum arcachonense]|nr:hypothetical protein [Sulfurospirillum arcachonense]HIP44286.1 hypothetical protein [Sulfurospirillum arcachonense]
MKNKKFFKLLLLEIIAVAGIFTYFFVDSADVYKLFMGNTQFYAQSPSCNLHINSCSADIPQIGSFEFDIEPKSIPLMETLTFTIKTKKDIYTDELDLHIYATNMNMGYHSFKMKKISENTYEAKGILPTCTVGGMIWNAEVVDGNKGGLFTFKTR